jgi:hypothetical protein
METTGDLLRLLDNKELKITYVMDGVVAVEVHTGRGAQGISIPGYPHDYPRPLVFLVKGEEALATSLPKMGRSWVFDLIENTRMDLKHVLEVAQAPALLEGWALGEMFVAAPLERCNGSYRFSGTIMVDMSGMAGNFNNYLFKCATAVLVDDVRDVASPTSSMCPFSLENAMGKCELGCKKCREGLSYAVHTK